MKVIVDNQSEAIEVARLIVSICNDIRIAIMDDVKQTSYEAFLCSIRDSIEVKSGN